MISWDNAPEYSYRGIRYMPHVDDYYDAEGALENRKVFHDCYEETKLSGDYGVIAPMFSASHSPYEFMDEDTFQYHVDMMLHECPHCGRASLKS